MSSIDRLKKQLGFSSEASSQDTEPSQEIATTTILSDPFQLRQALGWSVSNFNSVVWSPDGQRIAAVSDDRCVRIWNATTSELEHLLEGHQDLVWSVAWSPDGRLLASGSDDKTVRVCLQLSL